MTATGTFFKQWDTELLKEVNVVLKTTSKKLHHVSAAVEQ